MHNLTAIGAQSVNSFIKRICKLMIKIVGRVSLQETIKP